MVIYPLLKPRSNFVEARWVRNQLADPMHHGLGMRYLTHLKYVWKKADKSWDVWTEFPKCEDGY